MSELAYALIADAIAVFHGIVCIALASSFVFGTLMKRTFPTWWYVVWIPIVLVAISGQIILQDCPLNPIEDHFRELAGQTVHQGSFIGHHLAKLGIDIPAPILEVLVGFARCPIPQYVESVAHQQEP